MKTRFLGIACGCAFTLAVSVSSHAASVSGQGTWETTLQARDFDGDFATVEGYYDTALNITWLADANFARTSGYDADGLMQWFTANTWATSLNINGITGWRLPTVDSTGGCVFSYDGTNCGYNVNTSTGDLAHMFYITLGNKAYCNTSGSCPQSGYGLTNTALFRNLQSNDYWSDKQHAPGSMGGWFLGLGSGLQSNTNDENGRYAWVVHSGSVGAAIVPVPAAVWLFGSGLLWLIGMAHRKAA